MKNFLMMRKITLFCSLLLLMLLFTAQNTVAQTMESIGEVKSAEFIALVQAEMDFLELEQKTPVGAVKTAKNDMIIAYYTSAIKSFKEGAEIQDALMTITSTFDNAIENPQDATNYPDNSVIDPASADYKALGALVNALDFTDGSNADVSAILNFWRTLKNK